MEIKFLKGTSNNLPSKATPGFYYQCLDTGELYLGLEEGGSIKNSGY